MSMIVTPLPTVATLPASVRKLITGVNVAGILKTCLPAGIDVDAVIKPRDISMTHETARASIGAPLTAIALIRGLAYLTTAYSHGQGKPEDLSKGCKPFAVKALATACDLFKRGAGNVTLASLENALQAAIAGMLALPAPVKAAKAAEKLAIPGESRVIEDDAPMHSLAYGHEAHEDAIRASDASRINEPFLEAALAQINAEKAAMEAKDAEQADVDFVAGFLAIAKNRPDFAVEQLRQAAEALGYSIRKIPAKKAA